MVERLSKSVATSTETRRGGNQRRYPVDHIHDAEVCKPWRQWLWEKKILTLANGVVLFLALSSDGYNPFNAGVYSGSFIALRIMSYKLEYGYKLEHIIHVGLVPGPKKPFSLQPYLNILVENLITLAKKVVCPNPCDYTRICWLRLQITLVMAKLMDWKRMCLQMGVTNAGYQHTHAREPRKDVRAVFVTCWIRKMI